VDGTGSGSRSVAGSGISDVEPSGLTHLYASIDIQCNSIFFHRIQK
jgi:hypothetical protein